MTLRLRVALLEMRRMIVPRATTCSQWAPVRVWSFIRCRPVPNLQLLLPLLLLLLLLLLIFLLLILFLFLRPLLCVAQTRVRMQSVGRGQRGVSSLGLVSLLEYVL